MTFSRDGKTLIVHLEGTINYSNSAEVKAEIRNEIREHDRDLILDLKNLEFADSSGIGVMISLLKTITAKGGFIKMCSPNDELSFVLKMTKVDLIIPLFETLGDAKKNLAADYLGA